MIRIEPLGTGVLLPAFILGYELEEADREAVERLNPGVPWIVTLDQQAGGLAMSYRSVTGIVVRLAANAEHALQDVKPLVRGFRLMAQDPEMEALRRDYPILTPLVATRGQRYSVQEIGSLDQYVQKFFRVPNLSDGLEAFVRCLRSDLLDHFAGWRMLCAVIDPDRPPPLIYEGMSATHIDESNICAIALRDDRLFDTSTQRVLESIGERLPSGPDLGAFLLWENSD